jgi:hypothetical protein
MLPTSPPAPPEGPWLVSTSGLLRLANPARLHFYTRWAATLPFLPSSPPPSPL